MAKARNAVPGLDHASLEGYLRTLKVCCKPALPDATVFRHHEWFRSPGMLPPLIEPKAMDEITRGSTSKQIAIGKLESAVERKDRATHKVVPLRRDGGEREGQRSPPYVGLFCLILPTSTTNESGRAAPTPRGEWARVGSSSARPSPAERPKVDAFREGGS